MPSSSQQIRVQPQSQQVQVQQLQQQQQQQQQFITLPGGQQVAVRMATTASASATAAAATAQPAAAAQVMQFPQTQQIQQMVPVQIPVSQNGQTVYQTGMSIFSAARFVRFQKALYDFCLFLFQCKCQWQPKPYKLQ